MPNEFPTSTASPDPSRGISFVAPDINAAINNIRAKLGSSAVILDIRRAPARGIGRLWQKPQVEVVACLPETAGDSGAPVPEPRSRPRPPSAPATPPGPAPAPFSPPAPPAAPAAPIAPAAPASPTPVVRLAGVPQREALQRYARASLPSESAGEDSNPVQLPEAPVPSAGGLRETEPSSGWKCSSVFDRLGLTPLHAEQVLLQMREIHGAGRRPPETLAQELSLARTALTQLWREVPEPEDTGTAPLHVFLGPPGSGKSTALCKWLAQNTLIEGLPARVWRLDGRITNLSERVTLYAEILGVPAERIWNGRGDPGEVGFVDMAGADYQDSEGIDALGETLARLPGATVHLVLNAAYTVPLLLAQARAFSRLPVDDLVLTHLDEEAAWGKLWNLVLGTNYPLNRLSAGQNIPGRFLVARPEALSGSLFGG